MHQEFTHKKSLQIPDENSFFNGKSFLSRNQNPELTIKRRVNLEIQKEKKILHDKTPHGRSKDKLQTWKNSAVHITSKGLIFTIIQKTPRAQQETDNPKYKKAKNMKIAHN